MGDMTREIAFTKGHGTENDFVLVPDLDGARELTPETVAALADRRAGIGGDGVIRIVPAASAIEAEVRDQARSARWFMDYRNADGSVAEMCGNGTRVFAAYLRREGLETADEFAIATRAGVKTVRVEGEEFAVDLGPWRLTDPMAAERDGFDALVHVDVDRAEVDADLRQQFGPAGGAGCQIDLGLHRSVSSGSPLRPTLHQRGGD